MTTHPSSLDLESFACGEIRTTVEAHLAECGACSAFVERIRGALSAGPSRARAADMVARAAARSAASAGPQRADGAAREAARRRWWMTASTIAVPLAAAAVLVLLVRTPGTTTPITSIPSTGVAAAPTTGETTSDITFKGNVQAAVIRDRAGQQARFTGEVTVKPGDRLRIEVALDREQDILAAVMGDDGSWLELMGGVRGPGTHLSERSAKVDASPLSGTILVGSRDALAQARDTRRFDGLTTIRVAWEAP